MRIQPIGFRSFNESAGELLWIRELQLVDLHLDELLKFADLTVFAVTNGFLAGFHAA